MSDLLNFGFDPTGSALGSEGSPSMPMEQLTGMEHPMEATEQMLDDFVGQTQRRYGNVSDPGGSIWDPRGMNAMSSETSDYKNSDLMRPDEIPVRLNASDDQLMGGDPVLAQYVPDSSGFAQALYNEDIGFSVQGAASLANSLQSYDPRILDAIRIPRPVEPRVTNELGIASSGGLPDAFFDPSMGTVKQGVPEMVDRVIGQSAQYQQVDENGVVNKYSPGTSPYDAVSKGIIAGAPASSTASSSAVPVTPAQVRAFPKLLSLKKATYPSKSAASPAATSSYTNEASTSTVGGGTPVADPGGADPITTPGRAPGTTSGGGYTADSTDYTYGGAPAAGVEEGGSKWWLWLLVGGAAAGGIYLATRKKSKRGRR